jgi:hypothetical protein
MSDIERKSVEQGIRPQGGAAVISHDLLEMAG